MSNQKKYPLQETLLKSIEARHSSKPMKNFLIYIVLLIFVGCSYIDDDGIVFEEQIVGKFYIRQQARSEQIGLDYVEDWQRGAGIIEDCNKLIYDSIRKEIFVERRLWDSASSYYLINIIDGNAEKSLGAFKKKEIFEKTFFNKMDTCKHCLIWDMAVKRKPSSSSEYKRIDIKEARQLVRLEPNDLSTFLQIKQVLISDSNKIRKQNDKTTAPHNRTNWLSTNTYYLNQIDSSKYTVLFSRLEGKIANDIRIDRNGSVIFTIKQNVQMNDDNYNETYSHQLVSRDCNCPIDKVFNHVDSIFVDSIIDKNWRYTFYKALTGH